MERFLTNAIVIFALLAVIAGLFFRAVPAAAKPAPPPSVNVWRQGGDPVDWAQEGTTNYPVTNYTLQLGTAITDSNGQVMVIFPVAFSGSPILTYSTLGHVEVKMIAVGTAGVHFAANHSDGSPAPLVVIYWQAIGQ